MAIRIRSSGEIVCAAMYPALPDDVYLDDHQHYRISVICRALLPIANGRWKFIEQGTRDLSADESRHMIMENN